MSARAGTDGRHEGAPPEAFDRRSRMGLLARADPRSLAEKAAAVDLPPFHWVRPPETGLVMVRGRTGGSGAPFNLGEMTVTRCTLALATGETGHACVRGRSREHARLAALVDAAAEAPGLAATVAAAILEPLAREEAERRARAAAEADATRVDFFTMERGDNG